MAMFAPLDAGPLAHVRHFELRVGGAEANTAVGLARLGHTAGWISRVGDDGPGRAILHELRGAGLDLSRVKVDPRRQTGLFVKEILAFEKTRVYYYRRESAASALSPEDVDADYVRSARWVHLTGITPALSASARAAVERTLALAREAGIPVSFDPNLRLKLWTLEEARQVLLPLMAQCSVVLAGDEELALLMDTEEPRELAARTLALGTPMVVIKQAAKGALVATATAETQVPAFRVERIVDTIGAGDGFNAGFIAARLRGLDAAEAARWGHAAACQVLGVRGDWEGLPSLEELQAFLEGRGQTMR
jgi:2-dehydro-3-deoxygluconokinase